MNEKKFIEECKEYGIYPKRVIGQYRSGAKSIIYPVQTPHGHDYNGYHRGTVRAYEWTSRKGWTELFSNTTAHRAKTFLALYKAGKLKQVDPIVVGNYLTNGYSTRRGLLAHYTAEQIARMGGIAQSHADYIGHETGNSKADHENRIMLRKQILSKMKGE